MIGAALANLVYQYDPEAPEQIGMIDVDGPGIVRIADPEIAAKQITWKQRLQLKPIDPTSLEDIQQGTQQASRLALQVDGNVAATLADGGLFRAAKGVTGYFTAIFAREPKSAKASAAGNHLSDLKVAIVPQQVDADGEVSVVSSLVDVATKKLTLFFEKSATAVALDAKDKPRKPSLLSEAVRQPGRDGFHSPVARAKPKIRGNAIIAKFLLTPDSSEVQDLTIKGTVDVTHHVQAAGEELPIKLSGETMRLVRGDVSQGSGEDRLQLMSSPEAPAHLAIGDGFFTGPTVNVWPTDGVVRVAGAGKCQLPSAFLKRANINQANGSKTNKSLDVKWIQTPLCQWGDAFDFNGQTAQLTGGVSHRTRNL